MYILKYPISRPDISLLELRRWLFVQRRQLESRFHRDLSLRSQREVLHLICVKSMVFRRDDLFLRQLLEVECLLE